MISTILKKQSLINKIRLLNILGITAAMLTVLVVLSVLFFWFARKTLVNNVLADARLLATNTAPMLAFHDQEEAEKLASIFKKTSNLQRIVIFDQSHTPFVDIITQEAGYTPTAIEAEIPEIGEDTYRFQESCLLVFAPVFIENERLGTVVLESNLKSIRNGIVMFLTITSIATLLGIILSALILKKLHIWALAPVLSMSKLAEQVAIHKSYHLRAKVEGEDEIASLAMRFNEMLERITSTSHLLSNSSKSFSWLWDKLRRRPVVIPDSSIIAFRDISIARR